MQRDVVLAWLGEQLEPERFEDYCPNGLQVEGGTQVQRLATGVTASLAWIEQALAWGADTLLVHHGLFWRGQTGVVTGWMRQRLAPLLAADANLLAFHLPLDAHPAWGNNAQLGQRLGLQAFDGPAGRFGRQGLGWLGHDPSGLTLHDLAARCERALQRTPVVVGRPEQPLTRVAWCTGGAQGYFEAAIAAGAQAFITGEISEPQAHIARECGVAFLACGHHATERDGVQALGQAMAQRFGLEHAFFDVDNPA